MKHLALLFLLAAPGAAWAADSTIRSQDLPVGVVRMPAAAVAPVRFDLVAFHWQGPGHVLFKTRSQAGSWSGWRRADPLASPTREKNRRQLAAVPAQL